MEISKFNEKFNKLEGNIYTVEEEVVVNDGVYNGTLQHDNINKSSLNIYTGSKLTGEKITNYLISTPSETPWKNTIKIFSTVTPVYVSYETVGDQVEAEDINSLQDSIVATQKEINNYEESNNTRVSSAETRIETIEANKYDKNQVYTKEEVLQKINDLINGSPQTLDTLNEIAIALGNDPNFSTTIINLLGNKVDKVDGKQLSTEDYSTQEKNKLFGIEDNANNYIHPDKHPANMITTDDDHMFINKTEKAALITSVSGGEVYEIAGGTANTITLIISSFANGYAKTFIASFDNSGTATTINDKKLYKPGTTTAPNLKKDWPYTVWYNLTGDCFFIKASADGNTIPSHVLAGDTFSNYNDTGLVGTLDLSKLVTENIKNGVTINGVSGKSTVVDTQDAVLDPAYLVTGYSGYDDGVKKAGTMPLRGNEEYAGWRRAILGTVGATNGRAHFCIPNGAYFGNANAGIQGIFADDGNFVSSNILSGKSIFGLAGSIINRSAENWHQPSSSDCTSSANGYGAYIQPPQGYYDGNSWVRSLQPDLFAQNIISGKNIFGIGGTASIVSLGGKQHTTGSFTLNTQATYTGTIPFNIGAMKMNGSVLYFNGSTNINVNLTTCTVSGNTFTITSHSTSAIQCSYDIYEA